MRIALITDAYAPARTSAAVQMRDLARELARQGHEPVVLVPAADQEASCTTEVVDGVWVVSIKAPRTKGVGYVRRTLAELWMPFVMLARMRHGLPDWRRLDGVVWYSPSIFWGALALALKRAGECRAYLILRDIFPEWAVDMGLMKRGLPYRFFKQVERFQYRVADVIGVQAPSALAYFQGFPLASRQRVEVLQNWLADGRVGQCPIVLNRGALSGRRIFVYAGNMGVAQGMDVLLDLADQMSERLDVGFLFVGRGSEAGRLRVEARQRGLANVVFHDEIDPDEIPALYAQCHVGLLALDAKHRTHNIPGKFLSYMRAGLPVLAVVNRGNDLASLIREEGVGRVVEEADARVLRFQAAEMLDWLDRDGAEVARRCRSLAERLFSPAAAAAQILRGLR